MIFLQVPKPNSKRDALALVTRGPKFVDARAVEKAVRSVVVAVLGDDVAPGAPLIQAGLDSLGVALKF